MSSLSKMIAMRKETAVKSNNNSPTIRFAGFTDVWGYCKLKEITTLITKGTTPLDKSNTGDVNFVKIENINNDTGEITITQRISRCEHDTYLRRSQLKENDILFSIAGTLGRVTSVNANILPANTNQALAILRLKNGNNRYIKTYLKGKTISDFVRKNPTVGAQPNLSLEQVGNLEINLPCEVEQEQISSFFALLDCSISLHQRNHEKLVNFKKAMLDKMFPKNGELVPEVRFAGFSGNWERRKFRDVFAFLQNNTLPRAYLVNAGEGAKNIHYGDVLIKFGECVDVSSESLPIIEDVNVINKYRASALRNGDIIIADTAEDETAGKCTEIVGNNSEILLAGLHTVPCRPVINFAERYLGYYMNSRIFHNQLLPHMQGIKVVSISRSALQSTVIHYPKEIKEQLQIARLFNALDSQLVLLQQKLERFQNIKKACMEKMFV